MEQGESSRIRGFRRASAAEDLVHAPAPQALDIEGDVEEAGRLHLRGHLASHAVVEERWEVLRRDLDAGHLPVVADPALPEAESAERPDQRVFRVDSNPPRKPMTLDEAVLEMEKTRDYLVYRDAETGRVSVLVRRSDGNFDLVES